MIRAMNKSFLKALIKESIDKILPMDSRYVLTDLPYHLNIGDILIWEGEKAYFKSRPDVRCINSTSSLTFDFPSLSQDTVIFLHGGGSFGDLWKGSREFRIKIVSEYGGNRIVMFPQSLCYQSASLMRADLTEFNKHKQLFICLRDLQSYNTVREYFDTERLFLVPDMALFADYIKPNQQLNSQGTLFIKRKDIEATKNEPFLPNGTDIRDWPSFETFKWRTLLFRLLSRLTREFKQGTPIRLDALLDLYFDSVMRPMIVGMGINFISQYETIITSRLYGLILAYLLDKEIFYTDSTTGKIPAFVKTWLDDCDRIKSANVIDLSR